MLIAGAGDAVCCPGQGQDGTPVPVMGVTGQRDPVAVLGAAQNPGPQFPSKRAQGGFWDLRIFPGALVVSLLLGHKATAELSSQICCFFIHFCC